VVEFFLKSFLTLFVVMDPVGLVPVFLALAGGRSPREQARIARKAVLVAGGLLTFFFFFGRELLAYLGISLDALRVAGGILLFRIATEMVFAHHERETEEEAKEALERAYRFLPEVRFPGAAYRRDIGFRALRGSRA